MGKEEATMTTMILENKTVIQGVLPALSGWGAPARRLIALLKEFFRRLNAMEPDMTVHERMKEYHHTKYQHLIHKF